MTTNNSVGKENPIEEQRKSALEHYNDLATRCSHWSGFVEAAIKAYNPKPISPQSSVGVEEMVLLRTESQKDGEHYSVMTRKEAEKMIQRNYEWRGQFKIICDVTKAMTEYSSILSKEKDRIINDYKEECDRLAGLVDFWQKKYYELNPPQQPLKIDNL